MKEIRLAGKIIRTLVKDHVKYPGRLIADVSAITARCGILLVLYWYVFKLNNGLINGVSYQVVAWSMFFYFAFSTFRLRDISRLIMQDVRSGSIEILFSKPVSYLMYRVWWQVGLGAYSFFMVAILGCFAIAIIAGVPPTMSLGIFIPTFALAFFGAMVLCLFLYSLIGLLAFWIEDIHPIFWIADKAVMILGGSYLPVALFPSSMYQVALYSPFGASQFITHTVYETWQLNWLTLIGMQIFWIIILGLATSFIFMKARKKVSINGG